MSAKKPICLLRRLEGAAPHRGGQAGGDLLLHAEGGVRAALFEIDDGEGWCRPARACMRSTAAGASPSTVSKCASARRSVGVRSGDRVSPGRGAVPVSAPPDPPPPATPRRKGFRTRPRRRGRGRRRTPACASSLSRDNRCTEPNRVISAWGPCTMPDRRRSLRSGHESEGCNGGGEDGVGDPALHRVHQRWHFGQKKVDRPLCTMRCTVPQLWSGHGSPSRP